MTVYLAVCLFAFFAVYVFIPVTKSLALQFGMVDRPNPRKIHQQPIPLSGGMAIYIGTILTLFLFFGTTPLHFVLAGGGLFLLIIGIVDDWFKSQGRDFPAWPKLLVQVTSACFAYVQGIQFFGLGHLWTGQGFIQFPEWLALLATVIWIVGLINMINFLDGMDGLAGGITIISSLTLFIIALLKNQHDIAILSIIIIGASLAFLRHNFHPATVFLGDAGSMFLGYAIGVTSLHGAMKGATFLTVVITLLAFGVPVLDTLQVMISRLKEGSPIYKPDKRHVHHRLLGIGLSQRQTVMVIYAIGIGFSVLSLLLLLLVS